MGYKKNIIGLSIFLLVFLLGLSTTSYASYLDLDELKNIIYNSVTNFNTNPDNQFKEALDNFDYTNVESILDLNYVYVYSDILDALPTTNSKIGIATIYGVNTDTKLSTTTNKYTKGYYTIRYNFVTGEMDYGLGTIFNSEQYISQNGDRLQDCRYNELPLYSGTSGNVTVTLEIGFHPDGIEDGIFSPSQDPEMTFIPISPVGAENVRIENNVGIDCLAVEKNSTYKSMKFGDLYVPSYYYITNINIVWWYYNRGTNRWLHKYILQEDGDDLTPSAYRSSIVNFKWEESFKDGDTTIIRYSVWINRDFVINDTIYQIAVIGTKFKDGSAKYVGQNYFIKSSNTTIVDGVLDVDYLRNTPYGDEYNQIVGDIASKVDELDDLTNSITAGIGNGLIGASGDWYPLNSLASGDDILGTAQLWGFRNYSNLYWDGIYQLLSNTFTVLGQTGSVDLDVSFHGYQKVISSDDIASPPNTIRDFISYCMITFTLIAIYKHFSKKIENIQAADTSKIKHEADDSNLM